MFTIDVIQRLTNVVDSCPYGTTAGRRTGTSARRANASPRPLYSEEERRRRDASPWTVVQGVLAPIQFLVFLVSVTLVLRYLATGEGYAMATFSIIVKTLVLYTIMVTGSIWERQIFGRYLFAPAFFWEDVVSMVVLALHTAYLAAILAGTLSPAEQMTLALAAYASYVINATQFVLKLRAARKAPAAWMPAGGLSPAGLSIAQ